MNQLCKKTTLLQTALRIAKFSVVCGLLDVAKESNATKCPVPGIVVRLEVH